MNPHWHIGTAALKVYLYFLFIFLQLSTFFCLRVLNIAFWIKRFMNFYVIVISRRVGSKNFSSKMPIGKCNFCIDSCGCYFYFLWFKKVRTTSLKLNVTKPNFYEIPFKKIGKILGLSTLSTSLPHIDLQQSDYYEITITIYTTVH